MLGLQQSEKKENKVKNFLEQPKKLLWSKTSWQQFVALHQPIYQDKKLLDNCLSQLNELPNLVHSLEIEQLKNHIAEGGRGQEFLLQCGDCAEQFKDCHPQIVANKIDLIFQLKKILEPQLKKKVIPIGRLAGQYAKPRSNEFEIQNGLSLPSFKGDIIHDSKFTLDARETNPSFMLTAYKNSKETLSYIKDLKLSSPFYISHEALLLNYESAFTRLVENQYYNTSAHMLWLGERTRKLEEAHVEYLRGIQNPVGIKLSHKVTNYELIQLISILNSSQKEGKILLIPRLGSHHVDTHLPRFIQAVKKANAKVTWMCDPMHGNGELLDNGIKTRRFENISYELLRSVQIHKIYGSILGGVHLETAADDVTECLGGKQQLNSNDLKKNYKSVCDPRLNILQSHELIESLADEITSL